MKIRNECIVEIAYELFDDAGELAESSADDGPIAYMHGLHEILPGLEEALEGREAGDHFRVEVASADAYGDYDPEGLMTVPRSEFPPDAEIVPGDWIGVTIGDDEDEEESDEEEIEMLVIEISPEAVVLDGNHPLAGKDVTFVVDVLSVREALPEEIAQAREGHVHDESCGHAPEAEA